MKLGLILGDQLYTTPVPADHYVMIESRELTEHYTYHKHKLIFFLASMRNYAEQQNNITYHKLDEKSFEEKLLKTIQHTQATTLTHYEIEDKFFSKKITDFCTQHSLQQEILPNPGFLTTRDEFASWRGDKTTLLQNNFYLWQRKRLNILITEGKPEGGKWNYDEENRKKLPKTYFQEPLPKVNSNKHLSDVKKLIETTYPNNPGTTDTFWLPTTKQEAQKFARHFFTKNYTGFGTYEDAIHNKNVFNNHSALSALLNNGLLTPHELLELAEQSNAPINDKEGYIRQLIGWREFIRGCYHTTNFSGNHFNHTRRMTRHWYDATTGIEPLDDSINKARRYGYTHHIERLMIQGNIMLLCEIHPQDVYKWFMEHYVDSADWVMEPNVYGMSQYSAGPIFATKPYICGSNYIKKMSNYARGDWCDIVDGLYWRFIRKNAETFANNHRMSMMVKLSQNKKYDEKIALAEEKIGEITRS